MSKSDTHQHLTSAHQLTAELRQLQEQMNRTVEQLCDLIIGADLNRTMPAAATAGSDEARETSLIPSFLQLPAQSTYARNPPTGHSISADARLYSNYRNGLIQVFQQPLPRQSDSRYSLILNYADFDGDLLSVVVDARNLLQGQVGGKARIGIVVEAVTGPHSALYAKCAWKAGKKWTERTFEVRPNQISIVNFDIDHLDCPNIQALDLHLLFNPAARGSVEIRRMSATLTITPAAEIAQEPAGIFENSP